jgi:transposase InsO family protein
VVVLQDRFRVSQRRACRLACQNRNTQRRHVRWGRRLIYRWLRLDGWSVNHKRVQRIWCEEGLQRPLPRGRKRSEYPHHVWAIDFQFDQTMDGRTLKFLNVIDTIEELLKLYPAPTHLRMDNGPEFIAHALQEWCTGNGSATAYIPPGSPWENPFVESFNGRFRDEFLNIELFATLQEAKL